MGKLETTGTNDEATPPNVAPVHYGMTNGQRWFIIIALTIAGLAVIGALTGRLPSSEATSVVPTQTRSTEVQGGNAAQQPASVPTVDQSPPAQVVYSYSNNDYMVGDGQGQMPAGLYQCSGDDLGIMYSSWTTWGDVNKKNILTVGSIGQGEHRFMTVETNAKMVSLNGDAVWIKVG